MTIREQLIAAKRLREAGEWAEARRLELFAMDELLAREYAEIEQPPEKQMRDLLLQARCLISEIVEDCGGDSSVTRHKAWLEMCEEVLR